ncbi:MAG: hypothetical protein NC548_44785 [Lachnospiraceae bacterium]|nr:hypothetical protein [Lachnospiraceae bacterium]
MRRQRNLPAFCISGECAAANTRGFFTGHVAHAWVIRDCMGQRLPDWKKWKNITNWVKSLKWDFGGFGYRDHIPDPDTHPVKTERSLQ